MSAEHLRALLRMFTYRPDWKFTIHEDRLLIRAIVIDTDNHQRLISLSFETFIPDMVKDDFDWPRWLLHAIMEVEDHEAREFFKIDGVKVFDPHG